jgi:hypothetical protein
MYTLSEQQIDFILNDIKTRGVEMEDLQLNLLDHICCIIERELQADGDFDQFYQQVIPKFFKKELKEIEEETILLLTFKNYYAMKKAMIRTGIVSTTLLITGSFFKIMHWPGAGPLLVFGIGILSIVFLPLMYILKTKDSSNLREKVVLGLSALIGFLLCWATLFTIMHWPGGDGLLWLTAVGVSAFLLIPIYFFTGIRNPDTRLNTIVTSIVLVGATGLLFIVINIRPSKRQLEIKMHTYIQSEELLRKMQQAVKGNNELATDINTTAEKIKSLIIENTLGQSTIPKDFEEQNILAEEENLGPDFFKSDGKGAILFSNLKKMVATYNATISTNEENKIPADHFQMDKMGSYNNYTVLNYLVQLQMYLATNDTKITAYKAIPTLRLMR